jgi:hypothetical protein
MSKETGGPAFPSPLTANVKEGMTLRDYFAAKASEEDIKFWMPMGVSVEKVHIDSFSDRRRITHEPGMYTREQARYRYAAAMLGARK